MLESGVAHHHLLSPLSHREAYSSVGESSTNSIWYFLARAVCLQRLWAILFNCSSKPRNESHLPVSPVTTTSVCCMSLILLAPLSCMATFSCATTASNNSHTFS